LTLVHLIETISASESRTSESGTGVELMRARFIGCGRDVNEYFLEDNKAVAINIGQDTWCRGAKGKEKDEESDDLNDNFLGGFCGGE